MNKFFTKKRIIWGVVILFVGGLIVSRFFKAPDVSAIQTELVKKQDIKQSVLATGQVTSETDLTLSFKTSGVVDKVLVKVGDKVKSGQVLANLSQTDLGARVTQARGSLAAAQASYKKVLEGASNEEILVSQRAVDVAQITFNNAQKTFSDSKKQQQVLVDNAYSALLSSNLEAVGKVGNIGTATPTISGSYNSKETGVYVISVTGSGNSPTFNYRGLEEGGGTVNIANPVAMGARGLYVLFPSTVYLNDTWTVNIPNIKSAYYVTNYNAYQSALQTQAVALTSAQNAVTAAEVALSQAQAALDLKRASARPVDLEAAEAQVLSAQGQLQATLADLENTFIRAPAEGTITSVDIKVGELSTALKQAVVLQDINKLHIEANVSEANIGSVKIGQSVILDFDALGTDRKFNATIQKIDPASTVISGVVNYKVTVGLEKIEEIKPGMTANLTVLTGAKSKILTIPQRAVVSKDGKKYVRVVTDAKKKTFNQVEVNLGMEGDGGLVEVVSGLNEGQEIVSFIKAK